jgi:putative MATE family efflux protein
MALALGLFYSAAVFALSKKMTGFFHIREANVASWARQYLLIVGIAFPANFISAAVAGIFTGAGNSRAPFMINAAGLALNAVLDVIFIFGLGMGVAGAAAATSAAQFAACAISLAALTRKRDRPFARFRLLEKPDRAAVADIVRWTLPLSVVSIFFTFFTMFISRLAAGFGAGAIAVYRVGTQIESVCWLTSEGIATSVSAFVGQNYGAAKFARIREGVRTALVSWCSMGAVITVLFIALGRPLFGFFLPDPEIIDMGAAFLRILALSEVFGCLEAISFGSMRGLGRTIPQFVVSTGCSILRAPMAYALSNVMGVNGIWWSVTITASMRGFLAYLCFRREIKRLPR